MVTVEVLTVKVLFISFLTNIVSGFKERFRIDKCDINTGKVRHDVVNHLIVCYSSASKSELL